MLKLRKKHPLAIRWLHWINVPVLLVMIWSGMLIYGAHRSYRIGFGDWTLYAFDTKFAEALGLRYRLAEGMAWHFAFMWLFALNGVVYVVYLWRSKEYRELLPARRSILEAWQIVLRDLRLRRAKPPQGKYNGAQRLAYTGVIVMGFGSLLSGLAIYKPTQLAILTGLFGGYQNARFVHFWLTMFFCLFIGIHVLQVVRAGWNNFRGMVTGYEVTEIGEGESDG